MICYFQIVFSLIYHFECQHTWHRSCLICNTVATWHQSCWDQQGLGSPFLLMLLFLVDLSFSSIATLFFFFLGPSTIFGGLRNITFKENKQYNLCSIDLQTVSVRFKLSQVNTGLEMVGGGAVCLMIWYKFVSIFWTLKVWAVGTPGHAPIKCQLGITWVHPENVTSKLFAAECCENQRWRRRFRILNTMLVFYQFLHVMVDLRPQKQIA